jgi:transcriptional regulator with XRE-family HTH domain
MSIAMSTATVGQVEDVSLVNAFPRQHRPLHRLAEAREQEGLSRRAMARRLGITPSQVQQQEDACSDLPLSALYAWQDVLQVPLAELLVEGEYELSPPILRRAQLLRIMKTVQTILERSRQASIRRMAQVMIDQILEVMPELKEVGSWPAVGQRRTSRELGQAASRRLCYEALLDIDSSER